MTKVRWIFPVAAELTMTAWHTSCGDVMALPQVGHRIVCGEEKFVVTDVRWTYGDFAGFRQRPTEIAITLEAA